MTKRKYTLIKTRYVACPFIVWVDGVMKVFDKKKEAEDHIKKLGGEIIFEDET